MKKNTKTILGMIVMLMLCLCISTDARANDKLEKKQYKGFIYAIEDIGNRAGDIRILNYKGKARNLTIPSEIRGREVATVESLGKSKNITSVSIPDNVEIKCGALSECPNLKTINISKQNPYYIIKNKMLLSKDGKTLVTCPGGIKYPEIPDSVTIIGNYAFEDSSVKKINLGKNITHLGDYVFLNCKELEEINFHEDIGIKNIYNQTFRGCKSLKTIIIPNSVVRWDDSFWGCTSLETIVIGKNLKEMSVIYQCPNLKAIYFYNEKCEVVFEPEDYGYAFIIEQFSDCADHVTLYGFENSTAVRGAKKFGIKYEVIEESTCHNAQRSGDFEYIIEKGNTASITNYTGKESKLTIPTVIDGMPVKKVKSLGESQYLKEVHIPDGMTVKGGVLSSCPNLKKASVASTNTKYRVKNKMLLSKDGKTLVACPGGLTEPKIPSSVTKIADGAFMGSSIKKITLGKNITTLGNAVFKNCKQLATVKFHKDIKVKQIKNSVFENCKSLQTIELPKSVKQIWNYVFSGCTKLKTVKIQKNLKYVGLGVMKGCKSLRSVYIYSKDYVAVDMMFDSLLENIDEQGKVTVYGKKDSTTQEEANSFTHVRFKVIK